MSDESANEFFGDVVNAGMSRRGVVRVAGVGALVLGLGGATRTATAAPAVASDASSTHGSTPDGLGSVSRAPHLPAGFTKTFTSRYIYAGGLRQHAVIGGDGPPLLLVHGWPENWYAWRRLMPGSSMLTVFAPRLAVFCDRILLYARFRAMVSKNAHSASPRYSSIAS